MAGICSGSADLLRHLDGTQKIVYFAPVSAFELVEQKANNKVKGQLTMSGKGGFAGAMLGDKNRIVQAVKKWV